MQGKFSNLPKNVSRGFEKNFKIYIRLLIHHCGGHAALCPPYELTPHQAELPGDCDKIRKMDNKMLLLLKFMSPITAGYLRAI